MTVIDPATTLVQEITINAPAAKVFAALTDPEKLPLWWGDDEMYRVTRMESDLRAGGKWRSSGKGADGAEFAVWGVYRVVDAPRLLEYTWLHDWDAADGAKETVVRFDLDERDGATHLRVTHSGFATVESKRDHDDGWVRVLGWLRGYLE